MKVIGILLAGGLSRRMGGGDKNLLLLGEKPILAHTIERAQAQVSELILNANEDPGRFEAFGLNVVGDTIEGRLGPLAGILTGMEWAHQHSPDSKWLASFPTDAPFLPVDMVAQFLSAATSHNFDIVCGTSMKRAHPTFGLWRMCLKEELHDAIVHEGVRKIDRWTERFSLGYVNFEGGGIDPFFNINSPGDLDEAREIYEFIRQKENGG